jgi:HlyD family secretion protein/epimerase transport system membrane fusion protein
MASRALIPAAGLDWAPPEAPPRPPVRGWIVAGFVIAAAALGGFGSWAALAPLSSAAMAPGVVKVDSNRKTIQHLEGGIIGELLVRDGDTVAEGDVLVRLDDVETGAAFTAQQGALDALMAQEPRLLAQRDVDGSVTYPDDLAGRRDHPAIADIVAGQDRIFQNQRRTLEARLGLLGQRIEQHRSEIGTLKSALGTHGRQHALLREELADARMLYELGYGRKPHVLSLERAVAAKESDLSDTRGRIAVLRDRITGAEMEMASLRNIHAMEVSQELREVQTKKSVLEQQLRTAKARLERGAVLAPRAGIVMNSRYFSPGAVIPPGGAIMDLVPLRDELVIEAKVRPLDIDSVRVGMPALVRLVAFKQRSTPTLSGTVTLVSADAVLDERSDETHFTANVAVDTSEMARAPNVSLYPGMPVEVAIVTGERTFLDYILQPVLDSFAHSFREE